MNSNENLWLIGKIKPIESAKKLPKTIDVLKAFLYHQIINGQTSDNCAKKLASELITIWQKNKFSTLQIQNVIIKIMKLKNGFDALKKCRFRRTDRQSEDEKKFMKNAQSLFNIKSQKVNEFCPKSAQDIDDRDIEPVKNVTPMDSNDQLYPTKRI